MRQLLLDSNILLRAANSADTKHLLVLDLLQQFTNEGQTLCITPQCLYEYYTVATRSVAKNGLGISSDEARQDINDFLQLFVLISDTESTLAKWLDLLASYDVRGINAHDAHIVASMLTQHISRLLTFNIKDFNIYSEIQVIDPMGAIQQTITSS